MTFMLRRQSRIKGKENTNISNIKNLLGSNGLTLIELMVVISIIGIMLLSGGFYLKNFSAQNKLNNLAQNVFDDLTFAKFKAMEGQTFISICFDKNIKINNGTPVTMDYLIVRSMDCNASHFDAILKTRVMSEGTTNFTKQINTNRITFDPNGFVEGVNNITLTLKAHHADEDIAKDIIINRFGRIVIGDMYEEN